jgi:hypothetical protein
VVSIILPLQTMLMVDILAIAREAVVVGIELIAV